MSGNLRQKYALLRQDLPIKKISGKHRQGLPKVAVLCRKSQSMMLYPIGEREKKTLVEE
jgi:hypothetical protein